MSSTSCQINFKPHEGGFDTEFPPLLQSSTITPEELKKTLESISEEFQEIFESSQNLKRWSRFGLLVFSFVLTSVVGIALWLLVFLTQGLLWFIILFLGFILIEGAFFVVLIYGIGWYLDNRAKRQFTKLQDSLSAESSSKYEPKGVQLSLKYLTESVEIMPSIKIQLLEAFDPKSAWHKFPTIIIGKDKVGSKVVHEKNSNVKSGTYALLDDE